MKNILAILSFAMVVVSMVPYIVDVLKKRVVPERISWLLWAALGATYFVSALTTGGGILFTFGELLCPTIIFFLSIKYGVGGKSWFDRICLIVAAVAFALLIVVDNPIFGLVLALFVDCIGMVLTVRKLAKDRSSEPRAPWGLAVIAAILSIVALESYTVENLLFPLYIVVSCSLLFFMSKPDKTGKAKLRELEKL
jgi:hypothetical protein